MRLAPALRALTGDLLFVDGAKILAVNVAGAGLAFVSHVLFARWLGVASYGTYVFALSWLSILLIVLQAGLNLSMVRFIAEYRAHANRRAMQAVIRFSNTVVLTLGALAVLVGGAIVTWKLADASDEIRHTFYGTLALAVVVALIQQRAAVLQGLERVVQSTFAFEILRPLALLAAVFAVAQSVRLDAAVVMTVNLAVSAGVLAVLIIYARSRVLAEPAGTGAAVPSWREWLRTSLPYVVVTGLTILLTQMDILMIGHMLGPEQAGLYAPAAKVALVAIFPVVAIRARLAPMAATLFAEHRIGALQNRITTATVASTAACLCLLIVIISWREPILSLFGGAYTEGGPVIVVLATGYLVYSLAGAVEMFFLVGPFERQNALVVLASLGLNFILNLALIPTHGMIGAAWATVGAIILRAMASIVIVFHRTRLTPLARTRGDL